LYSISSSTDTSTTTFSTLSLHDALPIYFRNDALDANPFFANHFADPAQRQKTPLHLNQFGGTLGGPIRKNKLFFFAAYQGDRFRSEEHTSELQSRFDLVCRLLLEKKKII